MANLANMTVMLEAYRDELMHAGMTDQAMSIRGLEVFDKDGAFLALNTLRDMRVDSTLSEIHRQIISDLKECLISKAA